MNSSRASEDRLAQCFASVFPDVPPAQIREVTSQSVEGWDSVAFVTLIAAIEEEFQVTIPPDAYPKLDSFAAFARQLQRL
jgi:acyl carrier protein